MPSVDIHLRFTVQPPDGTPERRYLTRTVTTPQVPRQGDNLVLDEDGDWNEEIRRVFWHLDGSAVIDIDAGVVQYPDDIAAVDALTDQGWS